MNDRSIRLLRGAALIFFGCVALLALTSLLFGSWTRGIEERLGFVAPPVEQSAAGAAVGVPIGGPFTLVDAKTGQTVTDRSYRGHWTLLYFGYSFCPDVCPTDLQRIVAALGQMGPLGEKITPVFVTVDPARDTVPAVARYVGLFGPRLVGLTGSQAQVDGIVAAFRVFVEKQPPETPGGAYLVNHSAFMYLMNPEGKLAGLYPPSDQAPALAAAWKSVVSQGG